jgi:hypothetical protein
MIPSKADGRFEYAATAATKLLKSMTVRTKDDYTIDRLTLERVQEAIALAEKALGDGEQILLSFARVRTAFDAKRSPRRPRPTMYNLYSITTNQAAPSSRFSES